MKRWAIIILGFLVCLLAQCSSSPAQLKNWRGWDTYQVIMWSTGDVNNFPLWIEHLKELGSLPRNASEEETPSLSSNRASASTQKTSSLSSASFTADNRSTTMTSKHIPPPEINNSSSASPAFITPAIGRKQRKSLRTSSPSTLPIILSSTTSGMNLPSAYLPTLWTTVSPPTPLKPSANG